MTLLFTSVTVAVSARGVLRRDASAGGPGGSDAERNLGRRAGIEVARVAAGLGNGAGNEAGARSLGCGHPVLVDGNHARAGRGVRQVANDIVAVVRAVPSTRQNVGAAEKHGLSGAVGGVGGGVKLRGLALRKAFGRTAGRIRRTLHRQAGDDRMGIDRDLVAGKSVRADRHVGNARLVGGEHVV